MKATEKIKLIRAISKKLDEEEYGIIDLTLRQFDIPTSEDFNGTKINYIIEHIQQAPSETLVELADHLELITSSGQDINPGYWEGDSFRLFISHLASDKANAEILKKNLDSYGISSFVAHSDIEPTKEWQEQIELGLRTCDALVALIIKDFELSNWTDQEIGFALGRDLLVIPVRMGKDPYGFIGKYQAITYKTMENLALDIFDSLIANKKTSKKMSYAIVSLFEESNSFLQAKTRMGMIEKLIYWDSKLKSRLTVATDNNSQIRGSFGLPARIRYFVTQIKL